MNEAVKSNWWMQVSRGVAGILFGSIAIFFPDVTLVIMIALFASYSIVAGAAILVSSIPRKAPNSNRALSVITGLVSMGAGLIALYLPSITTLVLTCIIGVNALVNAAYDFINAYHYREKKRVAALLFVVGLIALLFGLTVLISPATGVLATIWLVGMYALVTGSMLVIVGFATKGSLGMKKAVSVSSTS